MNKFRILDVEFHQSEVEGIGDSEGTSRTDAVEDLEC
jgi:hypothetical protein